MTITIYHGDAVDVLPTLAPGSVQCIVTSPPYFNLRDYGIAPTAWPAIDYAPMPGLPPITIPPMTCCMGLEDSPLAYVAHLVHVFRLARPALADDSTAWLNIGDCYAGGGHGGGGSFERDGMARSKGLAKPPTSGVKPKDLMLIPARVALALQADGWYVRNQAIWHKPNAMPESVKDRLTVDYESLYLLAKSPRYYFDAAAIAEPAKRAGDTQAFGGKKGRKYTPAPDDPNFRNGSDQWGRTVTVGGTRNRRTVWRIPTEALRDEHYAPMPQALVEPCILAGSRPGDTVLDFFFGSGTVGRVALQYGRSCIGIDKNDAYVDMSERRTNGVQVHMEALL